MRLSFGAATHPGAVRERNEDNGLAKPPVFAVADGMGGHAAGDVASALAVSVLDGLAGRDDLGPDDVVDAVLSANAAIRASGAEHPERAGMGTTLTGVVLVRVDGAQQWAVFNVGDSRVYRLFQGRLEQLTADHSEVAELMAQGRLTAEEARVHPLRNIVTRSLGTEAAPRPDVWLRAPEPGERLIACSDGLPLELPDARIAEIAARAASADEAAQALVQAAVDAGGRDNVTVVVVDVLPDAS